MNVKASDPFSKTSFEKTKQGSNTTHGFANTAALDVEGTQIHETDCFQFNFTIFLKRKKKEGRKEAKRNKGRKQEGKKGKRKSISQSILQVLGVFSLTQHTYFPNN